MCDLLVEAVGARLEVQPMDSIFYPINASATANRHAGTRTSIVLEGERMYLRSTYHDIPARTILI